MTVSAPGSASNVTVVVERKVRSPGLPSPSVRSKVDPVVVDGDQRGAFDGLITGEVGESHVSNLGGDAGREVAEGEPTDSARAITCPGGNWTAAARVVLNG